MDKHFSNNENSQLTDVKRLVLTVRPEAYPRGESLKGTLLEYAPALPANIRLGWRGLPKTNTLAYCKHS
jgi:hypothetical protein